MTICPPDVGNIAEGVFFCFFFVLFFSDLSYQQVERNQFARRSHNVHPVRLAICMT